jgi:pyrroloquinoline quinone (PQQ) biosynthesis protein C
MSDFFEQLQEATREEREQLLSIPFIQLGARGELGLKSYIAFLTQAYHHVKHTTPLLMACGSRIPASKEWLRDAMAHYIEEEVGHQEWILNDIGACGADPEKVRHTKPDMPAELMCAYAYHIIDRKNPIGFLGMVLVLEGTSIRLATEAANNIQKALKLPDSAFTYLQSHGSLDLSHMDFYRSLVNRLDSREDKDAVIHCARRFYRLYGDIFRNLPLCKLDTHEAN